MAAGFNLGNITEKLLAGKWLAGATIDDAVKRAKELNSGRIGAVINYLGEDFENKHDVSDAVFTYLQLIKAIKKNNLDAGISLKMTQLGLKMGRAYAKRNWERVVGTARKHGVFTFLDMESHDLIDDAISIYESQLRKGMVGITLQAYLRRSEKDMVKLVKRHAVIRLVKGAYKEGSRIAFQERKEVESNYVNMMRYLFKNSSAFTIATHDHALIKEAITLNRVYRREVTFAMLNGIMSKYAANLAARGNRVAIYVPFGSRWLDYGVRRLREEGHLILVAKSLLGG